MADKEKRRGFWSTLPGILTALGSLIGAIVGAYVAITSISPTPQPPSPVIVHTIPSTPGSETTPPPVTPSDNPTTPPTTIPPPTKYSVSGIWEYKAESQMNGVKCTNRLRLTMDGSVVTGVFTTCDHTGSGVEGTFHDNTLEFSRNTGLETIQEFKFIKESDDKFSGKFWNVGKYDDFGIITIKR